MSVAKWSVPLLGVFWTVALILLPTRGVDAHKGITSKYTFDDDVFPILRDKCGRCHVEGGSAPMSLMFYQGDGGAVAWAESIREMLVDEAMPPWYVDPAGPPVKGTQSLSARELDIVVSWAAGGTPQGDLNHKPAPMVAHAQWTLGQPDLILPIPKAVNLPPGEMEETIDVTVPTKLTESKWVKAADLLPGTPSIVRSATISIENGPVLAVWEPGDSAVPAPEGTAFQLPAGANLALHIRYKKGYLDEQKTKTDQSTVGLYFAELPRSGKAIQAFMVAGHMGGESAGSAPRTFSAPLTAGGQLLAIRPLVDQPYSAVSVTAIAASGRRIPLLKLRGIRPEWPRRYWLAKPIELAAGITIEVVTTPGDSDSGPLIAAPKSPLQIALDLAPQ